MKNNKDGNKNPNYRHGMRGTRFYSIWADMKKRCDNPKATNYKNYGGRDITYDESWSDFITFKNDMFVGYLDTLTLERKRVNENYSKDNCTWVTIPEQSRNHRKRLDNFSGIVGVCKNKKFNKKVNKEYACWTANWQDEDEKTKSKSFSINKYGESGAFDLACEHRKKMLEFLALKGIEYGKEHHNERTTQ